jgi:hypothetical protein
MFHRQSVNPFRAALVVTVLFVSVGCSSSPQDQRARDERTRDEAAKATERAKPVIEETGRKIGEVAHRAADEARAAAEGVREGWNKTPNGSVNLNSAIQPQLLDSGISRPQAHEISTHRPYRDPHGLVTKGILSRDQYLKIRDHVTAE